MGQRATNKEHRIADGFEKVRTQGEFTPALSFHKNILATYFYERTSMSGYRACEHELAGLGEHLEHREVAHRNAVATHAAGHTHTFGDATTRATAGSWGVVVVIPRTFADVLPRCASTTSM